MHYLIYNIFIVIQNYITILIYKYKNYLLKKKNRDLIGVITTGKSVMRMIPLPEKPMKHCSEYLFCNQQVQDSKTSPTLFVKELKQIIIILSPKEKK